MSKEDDVVFRAKEFALVQPKGGRIVEVWCSKLRVKMYDVPINTPIASIQAFVQGWLRAHQLGFMSGSKTA